MIKLIIHIEPEIVKHFDCLYGSFPPEDAQRAIEQDINTILKMHFDDRICIDPIRMDNSGWMNAGMVVAEGGMEF